MTTYSIRKGLHRLHRLRPRITSEAGFAATHRPRIDHTVSNDGFPSSPSVL